MNTIYSRLRTHKRVSPTKPHAWVLQHYLGIQLLLRPFKSTWEIIYIRIHMWRWGWITIPSLIHLLISHWVLRWILSLSIPVSSRRGNIESLISKAPSIIRFSWMNQWHIIILSPIVHIEISSHLLPTWRVIASPIVFRVNHLHGSLSKSTFTRRITTSF